MESYFVKEENCCIYTSPVDCQIQLRELLLRWKNLATPFSQRCSHINPSSVIIKPNHNATGGYTDEKEKELRVYKVQH